MTTHHVHGGQLAAIHVLHDAGVQPGTLRAVGNYTNGRVAGLDAKGQPVKVTYGNRPVGGFVTDWRAHRDDTGVHLHLTLDTGYQVVARFDLEDAHLAADELDQQACETSPDSIDDKDIAVDRAIQYWDAS